jgi:hypothetical protein
VLNKEQIEHFLKVIEEVNQFLSDFARFLAFVGSKLQELNQRLS